MKILVLGAGGNVGGALIRLYDGEDVVGWDRGDLDVLDFEELSVKIRELAPDLVYNCVAYNSVDGAEGEGRELVYGLNVEYPSVLAGICDDIGAKLVHFSTGYVFDGEISAGYVESDEVNPLSEYAKSKLGGELEVLKYDGVYVIRLNWLFGPKGSSENSKPSFVDFISEFARLKGHLDLVEDESASPVYSEDLVRRTREIVEDMAPGVSHVCNSGSCTWKELAEAAFEIQGIEVDIDGVSGAIFKRAAVRSRYSELKSEKMPVLRSWREALKDYLLNK